VCWTIIASGAMGLWGHGPMCLWTYAPPLAQVFVFLEKESNTQVFLFSGFPAFHNSSPGPSHASAASSDAASDVTQTSGQLSR
jgi:hypothetical protein